MDVGKNVPARTEDAENEQDDQEDQGSTRRTRMPTKQKASKAKKSRKGLKCWSGYERVPGKKPGTKGSCRKKRS